jgi:hypothetical protein
MADADRFWAPDPLPPPPASPAEVAEIGSFEELLRATRSDL